MRKTIIVLGILFGLAFSVAAQAAEWTIINDITRPKKSGWSGTHRFITAAFSSTDGTADRTAVAAQVSGMILGFHYAPDGTSTPDAAADIQVFKSATGGVNLLYGACDDVGATETEPSLTDFIGTELDEDTIYFYAGSLGAGTNAGRLTLKIKLP